MPTPPAPSCRDPGFPPRSRAPITLHLTLVNFGVTLWVVALLNAPFWRELWHAVGGWDTSRALFLLSLPLFVMLWVWVILEALTWGRFAKPVLGAVLLLSAAASYFMSVYGVVIDRSMIENVAATDPGEALELLNFKLLLWMLAFGAAPAWLLCRVRLVRQPWYGHLLGKATALGVLVSASALVVAPFFQSYAPLVRNHRELRMYLVPSNYVGALHSYVKTRLTAPDRLETVADDVVRMVRAGDGGRHTLTVLVIGETARAANFGLDGYPRQTTPNLAAERGVINFRRVSSCGTSTAVSLPCMFLDVGRARFSDALARRRENLLDVLQRAGLAVMWRDNNSGCKGLCDRVRFEDLSHAGVASLCTQAECHDEVLLHGLQKQLDALDRDAVIVLHMKGSHGPAYHLRYPAAFERYTPVCRTNQLDRCGSEAIVNAYDNTLLYTDHVLARTIDLLRRNAGRFDGSLIYVSDHGESLGEHGLFLHGMPYAVAPPEQTQVPMVMWFSEAAQQRYGLDDACLRGKEEAALTHDNLYHSVLGLLDVRTRIYIPQRDVFHDCRAAPSTRRLRVGAPGSAPG